MVGSRLVLLWLVSVKCSRFEGFFSVFSSVLVVILLSVLVGKMMVILVLLCVEVVWVKVSRLCIVLILIL